MTIRSYDSVNNPFVFQNQINFRNNSGAAPILTKPIEKVENIVTNTVDTFVKQPEDEEKKKSYKTAIQAGSAALVLTGLVAILNPKFSRKLIGKLKSKAQAAEIKAKNDKGLQGKIYKGLHKVYDGTANILQFSNNFNPVKDEAFKWLCTKKKDVSGIKNETCRNIVSKIDSGFVKLMSKPYNACTRWFDNISKHTVQRKYKGARKNLNSFEEIINLYKDKLSAGERKKLEVKLQEIAQTKDYLSEKQVASRLKNQEVLMTDLEKDTIAKMKSYWQGLKQKGHRKEHIKNNMTFWAEDILMPKRNAIEQDGKKVLDSLLGDGKTQKGKYNEIFDILSPHLNEHEKTNFEKQLNSVSEKLRKANKSECIEYFDKKRDLMLGGAPTDVLTGIVGLGLSGVAIGTADNKDERVSRAVTVAFPALAGLGTSLAMTAMLFSGIQGMLIGACTSIGLSKIANKIDKNFIPKTPAANNEKPEVLYA